MEKTEIRAVEMVSEIRDRHYEVTKDLSREEFIAFIKRQAAKVTPEAARPTHR